MATIKYVNAKAEKLTGNPVKKNDNNQHWVEFKGYTISWYCNGRYDINGAAVCFYAKRIGDKDDYQSDYFAGTFLDNIKKAVDFVNRMTKPEETKTPIVI